MLFSNEKIARYIDEHFEPAWQSVRPVPTVTVDFGNGVVVTRTLHGNVATYLCSSDGKVLDILPGVYEPETYLMRLQGYTLLSRYANSAGARRARAMSDYHERKAEAIERGHRPVRLFEYRTLASSIAGVERGVKIVLQPELRIASRRAIATSPSTRRRLKPRDPDSPSDLAGWEALTIDTQVNENIRRQLIHRHLAKTALMTPADITKWLYREVLHADLDDPYLGLKSLLLPDGV